MNLITGCTFGDLHDAWIRKRDYLVSKSYNVVSIWEWEQKKRENERIRDFVKDLDIVERLEPRAALRGGRTEAFVQYYNLPANCSKIISYLDITSLYPSVVKKEGDRLFTPRVLTPAHQLYSEDLSTSLYVN